MHTIKRILGFIQKKKRGKISLLFLFALFIVSLLTPFIANDIPIVCKSKTGLKFPVIQKLWKGSAQANMDCEWSLNPLIPYSQKTIDIKNGRFASPFSKQNTTSLRTRHWLGTDALGRDSLAGLMYGSSIALRVGLFSALIALFLGLLVGTFAGYFGNNMLKLNGLQVVLVIGLIVLLLYQLSYGFFFGHAYDGLKEFVLFLLILALGSIGILNSASLLKQTIRVPVDNIVLWIFEVYKSIPNIFFLLVLLSIFVKSGVASLVFTLSFILWPIVARYTRAEILKLKEENFIKSAQVSGISSWGIVRSHLLLNAIGPALVSFAFSFSAAILLEATLSFLGLGLSVEEVSWGSMLSEVKNNYKAWWLALFPGLALFLVISALNYIGEMIGEFYAQS